MQRSLVLDVSCWKGVSSSVYSVLECPGSHSSVSRRRRGEDESSKLAHVPFVPRSRCDGSAEGCAMRGCFRSSEAASCTLRLLGVVCGVRVGGCSYTRPVQGDGLELATGPAAERASDSTVSPAVESGNDG